MLSHVNTAGKAAMVNISNKLPSLRTAIAGGTIKVTSDIYNAVIQNTNKKGDVIATSRLAGITGAKYTAQLIPLCHQLNLSHINVEIYENPNKKQFDITASCSTHNTTGVEMEALTAVNISALTFYDMCKGISQNMSIENIRLIKKTGGKSDIN